MENKTKSYLLGYRHPSIGLYTPTRNKKKVGILLSIFIVCLVTPCTNWIIPVVAKSISKFNPLWIYR